MKEVTQSCSTSLWPLVSQSQPSQQFLIQLSKTLSQDYTHVNQLEHLRQESSKKKEKNN